MTVLQDLFNSNCQAAIIAKKKDLAWHGIIHDIGRQHVKSKHSKHIATTSHNISKTSQQHLSTHPAFRTSDQDFYMQKVLCWSYARPGLSA